MNKQIISQMYYSNINGVEDQKVMDIEYDHKENKGMVHYQTMGPDREKKVYYTELTNYDIDKILNRKKINKNLKKRIKNLLKTKRKSKTKNKKMKVNKGKTKGKKGGRKRYKKTKKKN